MVSINSVTEKLRDIAARIQASDGPAADYIGPLIEDDLSRICWPLSPPDKSPSPRPAQYVFSYERAARADLLIAELEAINDLLSMRQEDLALEKLELATEQWITADRVPEA